MPTLAIAGNDILTNLNRREWLSIGAAAASGLLPSAAASKPGHDPIRLSLNENPFGPSLQAIRAQLGDLSSYAGHEVAELTTTIAAREGIAAE
jgi:histidinol-phosphate aminotransferase